MVPPPVVPRVGETIRLHFMAVTIEAKGSTMLSWIQKGLKCRSLTSKIGLAPSQHSAMLGVSLTPWFGPLEYIISLLGTHALNA